MQMDPHVQEILRATVIDLIMATDMKNHFALISRLQVRPRCYANSAAALASSAVGMELRDAAYTSHEHELPPEVQDIFELTQFSRASA